MAISHFTSRPPEPQVGRRFPCRARAAGTAGHDGADLGRGVELAGALAAALGEFAYEVFVALADDVGLDVLEPEALVADGLDEVGEAVVVEVALAVGGGVEVDAVDDALQERVFSGDGPHVGGDAFADLVGELRMTDQTGCSGSSGTSGR
jgi:hypothetical protein